MINKTLLLLFIVANCNGMNNASQLKIAINQGDISIALLLIKDNFNPKTYTVKYGVNTLRPLGHAIKRHGKINKNRVTINNLPVIKKILEKERTIDDPTRGGVLDETFQLYNNIASNNTALKKDFGTIISLLLKNEVTFADIEIDENDENHEEISIVVKSIYELCNNKIHAKQFDYATLQEFKEILEDCTPEMFKSFGLSKSDANIKKILFGKDMFTEIPQNSNIQDISLEYGNSKKREKETNDVYENKKPTKKIKKN